MAIANMDDLIAAIQTDQEIPVRKANPIPVATQFIDLWTCAGLPQAASTTASTGSGSVLNKSTQGAVNFNNAGSGKVLRLLGLGVQSPAPYSVLVYDRLVQATGYVANITTTQTINSVSVNRPDSTGAGCEIWVSNISVSSATGTTTTFTVSYTNQDGISGRTTEPLTTGTNWASRMALRCTLQAGDTGVRSIQSITFSVAASAAGNICVAITRPIFMAGTNIAGIPQTYNAFDLRTPIINQDSCLNFIAWASSTTSSAQFLACDLSIGET